MSLSFLKIHHLAPARNDVGALRLDAGFTACGRVSPTWARRCTSDPDYVTCEPCLEALVKESVRAIEESHMSTEEILERHG